MLNVTEAQIYEIIFLNTTLNFLADGPPRPSLGFNSINHTISGICFVTDHIWGSPKIENKCVQFHYLSQNIDYFQKRIVYDMFLVMIKFVPALKDLVLFLLQCIHLLLFTLFNPRFLQLI